MISRILIPAPRAGISGYKQTTPKEVDQLCRDVPGPKLGPHLSKWYSHQKLPQAITAYLVIHAGNQRQLDMIPSM